MRKIIFLDNLKEMKNLLSMYIRKIGKVYQFFVYQVDKNEEYLNFQAIYQISEKSMKNFRICILYA